MKMFKNQKKGKKILVSLLIMMLLQSFIYQPVQASLGGKLMQPVLDLVIGLGDRNNKYFTREYNGTISNFA